MARLDRPVRIWLATAELNDRKTVFRTIWADPIPAWAEISDAGSTYDPAFRGGSRPYSFITVIVRWNAEIATHAVEHMAVQIVGESGRTPQDTQAGTPNEGQEGGIDMGDAWAVGNRSLLEGADRRRFLALTCSRTKPIEV